MPGLIGDIFGGGKSEAKAAERTSTAALASSEKIARETREFLRQSQLISAGGISTSFGAPTAGAPTGISFQEFITKIAPILGGTLPAERLPAEVIDALRGNRPFSEQITAFLQDLHARTPQVAQTTGGEGPLTVTADPRRTGLVESLAGQLTGAAGRFGALSSRALSEIDLLRTRGLTGLQELRGQVEPGFGKLSQAIGRTFGAARTNLSDQRRRSIGDLRDNLARRRISGSSFAADAVTRREREFQRQEDVLFADEATAQAQAALQEIGLTGDLLTQERGFDRGTLLERIDAEAQFIEKETQLLTAGIQTFINELNLEADIGLKLTGIANAGISQIAAAQTESISAIANQTLRGLQSAQGSADEFQREVFGAGLGFAFG